MGAYTINVKATIPQVNPLTSLDWEANFSFVFDVRHDCTTSTITDKAIANMSFVIGTTATTQDATFEDAISTAHSNSAYCGAKVLTLTPTYSFVTISRTNIVLSTSNPADVGGPISMTLTVALADPNYAAVPALTKTFTVTITCAT